LTPFEPISSPLDWIPGEHGIHITFPSPLSPSRTLSATYLPEICPDQGWTKEETVLSAISKAGYRAHVEVGDTVWKSLKVKIYGSCKAMATWSDYDGWSREGKTKLK
jgi:AMMECR1 domain-containing protein